VVFATNYATNGQLFKNVLSGFGYDPQTTKSSMTVAAETTGAPTATPAATVTPTTTPTTTPTAAVTPTVTPTVKPSVTPTVTPKATAAPTPKETTAATAAPSGRVAPSVNAVAGSNSVTVTWNKISSPDLVGYKVVASVNCATPKYSENGYYAWITDLNATCCTINNGDGYNSGDVGTFTGGTPYYFSVTAIYGSEWQKIAGNAIQVTMPGAAAATPAPVLDPEGTYPAVTLNAPVMSGTVASLTWSRTTDTTGFQYYKVVVSTTNSTPAYPGDGYVYYTQNPDELAYPHDLGTPEIPTTYYISITSVYLVNEAYHYNAGNVQSVVLP